MQIVLSEKVKIQLHTMSAADRKQVRVWLDYLQNWEENAVVKERSVALDVQGRTVFLFRTTSDVHIFYTVDLQKKTVTVIDLATTDALLSFGMAATGGS